MKMKSLNRGNKNRTMVTNEGGVKEKLSERGFFSFLPRKGASFFYRGGMLLYFSSSAVDQVAEGVAVDTRPFGIRKKFWVRYDTIRQVRIP
jgi:hypothetical protein